MFCVLFFKAQPWVYLLWEDSLNHPQPTEFLLSLKTDLLSERLSTQLTQPNLFSCIQKQITESRIKKSHFLIRKKKKNPLKGLLLFNSAPI